MFGIISYKDLQYWDDIHPNRSFDLCLCGKNRDTFRRLDPSHGWYIMLLGNLQNETEGLKLVLDNYLYLNRRTRNVRFFMPGFVVDKNGISASPAQKHSEKFSFFENGFLETIDWLENGNIEYEYSEDMEMILLPYTKESKDAEAVYDFEHMLSFNLDQLIKEGKNIIQFITRAVKVVENKLNFEDTKRHMVGIQAQLPQTTSHKVFIAGAKALNRERDAIRSVFSQLSNRGNILYQTWTYEDFDRSFTLEGRQNDYNSFITTEADSIVFILNDRIGGITKNEFELALNNFLTTRHPIIHVYCLGYTNEQITPEIQEIRDIINNHNQYYTDYRDTNDLKNQIRRDFSDYINCPLKVKRSSTLFNI